MSWSSLPARLLCVGLIGSGLGGCLQPMYSSVGGHLGSELKAIAVDPVPDRLGHYLHDQLLTNLNGTGESVPPKYRLTLKARERVQTALIDVVTQRPQNATVITDVDYTLTPIGGTVPLVTGTVTSAASYDRSEQRYANIAASHDAEIRNARTLADQLTTRTAADLASPRPKPAVPVTSPSPPPVGVTSDASTLPSRASPAGDATGDATGE